ncbi:MAG: transporter substrate-binding domain-containing protein [Burkholderiales bacterium]
MSLEISTTARTALAPSGTLRVGLNMQNFLLVNKDPKSGKPFGIVPDLARELGRLAGLPLEFIAFDRAGKLAEAVQQGAWDVAFLAAEPARAKEIEFSPAYLEIDATYLVPAGSPIGGIGQVDRTGVRIAAAEKSAYDLYLTRTLKHATLVRAPGIDASYEMFVTDGLEALAGLKARLVTDAEKLPGSRILEGRFTAVQQAIGTPIGRGAGAAWLREFAAHAKASGLVAQAIARHGVRGVAVAP